jgi:sugar-phosphatase
LPESGSATFSPGLPAPRGGLQIEACGFLFDMDGTLVDSSAAVVATWTVFAEQHGLDVVRILADSHGRKARDTIRRFGPAGIDVDRAAAEVIAREIATINDMREIPGAAASERCPRMRWRW